MTRRTMAERKRRASERDARRESLLVLLSRTRRGVALTPSEAALMFAHVEVELAEADELRRTVAGQQNAIQAAHDRTAAAEAAIVETEQRAADAEEQLGAYRAVYGEGSAHVASVFRDHEAARTAAEADAERYKADCLSACGTIAEMHAAAVGEVRGPIRGVVEDVENVRLRAERRLDAWKRAEEDVDRWRRHAEQAEERLAELTPKAEADRASAERLAAALGRVCALARQMRAGSPQGAAAIYADRIEQTLANDPNALTPEQAAVHAAFAEAADSVEARIAEQAREHAIALAASRRNVVEASREARAQQHRADRYRTAWFAARRDRKADRAAMAAELHLVTAGRQALARADEVCVPRTVGAGHPVNALRKALTDPEPAAAPWRLISAYYESIHAECCPSKHK